MSFARSLARPRPSSGALWLTVCVLFLKVSQGDATEKLADQVTAQAAAPHRWAEEASGDPHEEEKDETH